MAFDIYQTITDKIISMMEQGQIPWHKPWVSRNEWAVSHNDGHRYSFLNQMLLDGMGGEWLTFKQAQAEGGTVRKGEKSHMVVFFRWIDKKDEQGNVVIGDDGKPEKIPFLQYSNVFEVSQCEGISRKYTKPAETLFPGADLKPDEQADKVVADYINRSGVTLKVQESNEAYYMPATDTVVVPCIQQYTEVGEYYSTVFHELTHSTGHESRLNRLTEKAAFGSQSYSREELVAEMGAAMVCGACGLDTEHTIKNSAAYLQNWLKALKSDKRLLVVAAGRAEKAANLILNKGAV